MLAKYDPKKHYLRKDELFAPFDAFIADFFNNANLQKGLIPKEYLAKGKYPKCNVWEDESSLFIEAGVPGLAKDQIRIQIEDEVLSISHQKSKNDKRYLIKELKESSWRRSFFLGEDLDLELVEAEVSKGLLSIRIQKKKKETNRKHIKTIEIK